MYLRLKDYYQQIQADNLNQIISSDPSIRLTAELASMSELKSYLVQKYDCDDEFRDTVAWNPATVYKAKQLVELDASAYNAATPYVVNNLVVFSGTVYICIQSGTGQTPSTATAYWTAIAAQYNLYFITLPKSEWLFTTMYTKGDEVFWKDKVYTALRDNMALQPDEYPTQWGSGVAYTVAAGILPTDTTKWTAGDNRSQQMVMHMIDIALYHLHSRISPRNIPQLRMDRYDLSIKWLQAAGKGSITADIPLIQPKSGRRIRFGGHPKNNNTY
jgi:hypothetical protein